MHAKSDQVHPDGFSDGCRPKDPPPPKWRINAQESTVDCLAVTCASPLRVPHRYKFLTVTCAGTAHSW
jgi:hypothetical protein